MPKKKAVRKKKPVKPKRTRPAFGFWYPDPDSPEADVTVIIKDFKVDHVITEECEEGYWGD